MVATPEAGMRPVGFLDDDPWKRRLRADGIGVLGSRKDLEAAALQTTATVLVIAVPSAGPELLRDLSKRAREVGLEVKVLPRVDELLTSRVTMRDVRDINVHDLLGRGVVDTDVASIAGYLTGKRVLVTGAGGSIGSELCVQINKWSPAELIMLDRDESGLHGVQLALHGQAMLDDPGVVLADIRDRDALMRVFRERRPEVVFHAAALKHLPMLEQYPVEAVKTNVIGTLNVLHAAAAVGAERFVNISTDKAADPTSVLGLSKRVAERLTASVAADTAGTYLSVRFGNVLGSRGSVLTSFAAQIAVGGPVTVTHPDVTRYFMTVQEAVQLVIGAAAIGRDGEALILDMGEPVSIRQVAEQLIEQSGRHDVDIVYTGLREGEKLHEVLLSADEVDHRPISPLFSHVQVPELHAAFVQSERLDVDEDVIRKRLYEWCVQEYATLQEEREYTPRSWSGVES
jgi:FlaA1/EpsC-like NDP-sugar epimerase